MKTPLLILSAGLLLSSPALAAPFGGVEFPQGSISFADSVVDYSRGSGVGAEYRLSEQSLGIPDYARRCRGCDYVSLGNGGSLTLEFTDNWLTGSDDDSLDLWVFEIGIAVEATDIAVSRDGLKWFDVGRVEGATSGLDLDVFGFGTDARFSFVRLTDALDGLGGRSYPSAGADIDAVGAISTIARNQDEPITDVPEPSMVLMLLGAGGAAFWTRSR